MWKIQPRGLFNCHLTAVVTCSKSKHHRMNGPHAHLKQRYSSWPPCKSWFAAYCQHGNRYITLKAPLKFLMTWLSVSQEYLLGLGVFLIPLSPVFILFFPLLWHRQVKKHLFNTFETSFNKLEELYTVSQELAGNSACVRKQHNETQDKGQLQALFCIKLKRKGTRTHSYHEGIPAQQKACLAQWPEATDAVHFIVWMRTAQKCRLLLQPMKSITTARDTSYAITKIIILFISVSIIYK